MTITGPPSVSLKVGDSIPLGVAILSASGATLTSDFEVTAGAASVARVTNGSITGVAQGTTTIQLEDTRSDLVISIIVHVVGAPVCGDGNCTSPTETVVTCPQDCACTDGVTVWSPDCHQCIDPQTDQCCTNTGGDPMVIPLGALCCATHFKCQPGEYYSPAVGLDPYGQCCVARTTNPINCVSPYVRALLADPTGGVYDYDCNMDFPSFDICVTDDYKLCQP